MKTATLFVALTFLFISCNSKTNENISIPPAPSSVEATAQLVQGKTYKAKKVAILSPFKMDAASPYEWMNETKDTTKFFKDYLAERMSLSFQFTNDTTVIMKEEDKTTTGSYKFDNEKGEDEKEGIKLRISYEDTSMNFPGATEPMVMTYTFFVAGADEKSVLFETPRSFNNRKVAILMQPE